MKLKEWLDKNKLSTVEIAYTTGLTYYQIFYILRGKTPTLQVAYRLVSFTKGEVGYDDLISAKDKKISKGLIETMKNDPSSKKKKKAGRKKSEEAILIPCSNL